MQGFLHGLRIIILTFSIIIPKTVLQSVIDRRTVSNEKVSEVSFLRLLNHIRLFILIQFLKFILINVHCCVFHAGAVDFGDTHGFGNITFSIKLLIVLIIRQIVLMKTEQLSLLIIHCHVGVLVIGLSQYGPFYQ